MTNALPELRENYPHFLTLQTRWMDNDLYGHVNNVNCYSYFDTVINQYLIEVGGLDIHRSTVIGIAAETKCTFKRSLVFPETIDAGLRVGHIGNSSVRYEVALFKATETGVAAFGHFVHVFVDRETDRPVTISVGHPHRPRAPAGTIGV